jgi:hypothetical protein
MAKKLSGSPHAHGCRRCVTRFQDNCTTPEVDGLCTACRGGKPWQALIDSNLPQDCCRELARLVTKEQKVTYRLAGARLWFFCPTCARTHPFDPRTQARTT